MNTKKLIDIFNKKAEEWLVDLNTFDKDLILEKPSHDSWSLAQVYDHVMRVTRKYQIPNLKKSMTEEANRRKKKNIKGFAVFNLGYRKNVQMKMEKWPKPIVDAFTPEQRTRAELSKDFTNFIKEVNHLENILIKSTKHNKQYHPFFGDITTKEWFALIELHIWQHDKQKEKIKRVLKMT